jgi:hypothetical protein
VSENVLVEVAELLGAHVDEVVLAKLAQLASQRGAQPGDFCLQFPPRL